MPDERAVLTRDPVLLLELTSGSTAPTKLIPYTAALKAEFGRAVAPWIVDLYSHHLPLFTGQAYWSVTPVTRRNERTPGGIPVGFEEDSEYFGRLQGALIRSIQAVPPLVRLIDDMDAFRYVTLLFLLRSRALTLISVWNPTFLILLVNRLARVVAAAGRRYISRHALSAHATCARPAGPADVAAQAGSAACGPDSGRRNGTR